MFVIKCPYCGERDQTEFSCHGESHIARPENPNEVSDKNGESIFFLEVIQKARIMKDGLMIMVVDSGLMYNAIQLLIR
jgi:sarcosine oxidase delta subunit